MQSFKVGEMTIDAGAPILSEGSKTPQMFTALKGMGLRYKTTVDGRRQVINFIFPGDFIGLQASVMGEMQHSVNAASRMTLCVFDRKALWTLFRDQPERAFDLTWLAAVEEHILGETLTSVGQRTGLERIAWAAVRIHQRMEALDLVRENALPFPYRQQDLADALGLSLVHTNKTLSKLRERQLLSWHDDKLHILDPKGLRKIAKIDEIEPLQRPLM